MQGRTLLSHDYVFWCGDFNYRINMARDDVKANVAKKDWDTLLSADQLKVSRDMSTNLTCIFLQISLILLTKPDFSDSI